MRNKQPNNRFFDNTLGNGIDFVFEKSNNIFAFTAIYEMFIREGNLENLGDAYKQCIKTGKIPAQPGTEVANNKTLGEKIAKLAKAWPQLSKNSDLYEAVHGVIGVFFGAWNTKDNKKLTAYSYTPDMPIYFNAGDFIDSFLDEDGNIKPMTEELNKTLDDYQSLATAWKRELAAQAESSRTPTPVIKKPAEDEAE